MAKISGSMPVSLRFGELEAILADINGIPSVQRTSFQARLKDIHRQGLLRLEEQPRGKATSYGLRELALMAIAVEMCQFGLSTKRAVEVMLADEFPLWMAIMMAAGAIISQPEVFNPGSADAGGDPNQEIWGFSPDWKDSKFTDPTSMFLYFDPSVLAPWSEVGTGAIGGDVASATFFYAGAGVVGDMIGRWTTGPSRRLALINVTKLIFDLSAHIAKADGLRICQGFLATAQDFVTRGDFDLDDWLANLAKGLGMMIAARPEIGGTADPFMSITDLKSGEDEYLGKFLVPVRQEVAEGEPHYVKDRTAPDMILRLPGQRELAIDAKVSLSGDIPQRAFQWRLQELSDEPYRNEFSDKTKYVVLYVPHESFLTDALAADNSLIDRALAQNVLIATPSIMLNLLAEVSEAWDNYREQFPDIGNEEFGELMGISTETEHGDG